MTQNTNNGTGNTGGGLRNLLTMARRVEKRDESVRWARNQLPASALLTLADDGTLSRQAVEDELRDDCPAEHRPTLSASVGEESAADVLDVLVALGVHVVTESERAAAEQAERAKRQQRAAAELVGALNSTRQALKRGGVDDPVASAIIGDGGEDSPLVKLAHRSATAGAVIDEPMQRAIADIRKRGGESAGLAMDAVAELIPAESAESGADSGAAESGGESEAGDDPPELDGSGDPPQAGESEADRRAAEAQRLDESASSKAAALLED